MANFLCFGTMNRFVRGQEHHEKIGFPADLTDPENAIQASTIVRDKALAPKSPEIALRNADSYCEFALLLLTKKSQ